MLKVIKKYLIVFMIICIIDDKKNYVFFIKYIKKIIFISDFVLSW